MADAPKPKIKVKVPKIIHQDLLAKNLEKIKEKEVKKLVVKIGKKTDISKLVELVDDWIINSNLRDKIIPLLTSDTSETSLKEIIGNILDCKIFQPNSKSLKDDSCGIVKNINFPNIVFIRNYSGKSIILSFLDLIFDGKDYDIITETTKINSKLVEKDIEPDIIEKFNKEIKIKEKINIENWVKLLEVISNEYGYNTFIIFNNHFDFPNVISQIESGKALLGLNIEETNIEKISFYNLELNEKIHMIVNSEVEIKIKDLSYSYTEKEAVKKPKTLLRIKSKPIKPISESLGYIFIDPNDIGEKLEVVKIKINGIDYQFLRGLSGNLYTRTSDNILIGRIMGDDLLLIENYQEYLN
jgi:hypothetical protein